MARRSKTRAAVSTEETKTDEQTVTPVDDSVTATPETVNIPERVLTTVTTEAAPIIPKPVVLSADLQRLSSLLSGYKLLLGNRVNDDATRMRIVHMFMNIVGVVLQTSDSKVFDTVYTFFVQNRIAMLNPSVALGSLYKLTDSVKLQQITAFYTVFSALVEAKTMNVPFTLSTPAIRTSLQNKDLVNWVITKRNHK